MMMIINDVHYDATPLPDFILSVLRHKEKIKVHHLKWNPLGVKY